MKELKNIVDGLNEIRTEITNQPALLKEAVDEDIHSYVENSLVKKIGPTGLKLHTGRSRNEQVSVDTRLFVKKKINDTTKISLCGNLKFDQDIPDQIEAISASIRQSFSVDGKVRPTLIAASTHETEERFVIDSFLEISFKIGRPISPKPATISFFIILFIFVC